MSFAKPAHPASGPSPSRPRSATTNGRIAMDTAEEDNPDAAIECGIAHTGDMSQPAGQPRSKPTPTGFRVLVVDDERALANLVGSYLTRDGFEVSMAYDGQQAIDRARQVDPDVMVLDLGLPVIDGVEVCRVVRTFSDCYIIMLTARTDEVDKLIGLSVGADDYLTKPFSPRELLARVHAMLRRPRASTTNAMPVQEAPPRVFGALSIDVAAREVRLNDEAVVLTRTEFDLLEALSNRPKLVFSRRQLIDAVWDQTWVGDEHLVDVHVGHLRRKLGDDPGSPRYVRTVRGVGYAMGEGA
jgi:DNA-binding response OmpR family regulator